MAGGRDDRRRWGPWGIMPARSTFTPSTRSSPSAPTSSGTGRDPVTGPSGVCLPGPGVRDPPADGRGGTSAHLPGLGRGPPRGQRPADGRHLVGLDQNLVITAPGHCTAKKALAPEGEARAGRDGKFGGARFGAWVLIVVGVPRRDVWGRQLKNPFDLVDHGHREHTTCRGFGVELRRGKSLPIDPEAAEEPP